jgi:hypothetical protein
MTEHQEHRQTPQQQLEQQQQQSWRPHHKHCPECTMIQSHSSTHHTSQLYTLSNIYSTQQHKLIRKLYKHAHKAHVSLLSLSLHLSPSFPSNTPPLGIADSLLGCSTHTPATAHTTDNTRARLQTPCTQTNSTGVRTEMYTHAVQVMPPKPCTTTQSPKPYTTPTKPQNPATARTLQSTPAVSGLHRQTPAFQGSKSKAAAAQTNNPKEP